MVSGLLYGVSPIDLLPDLIPLIGWVDDAILVPLMLILALIGFNRWKAKGRPTRMQGHDVIDVKPNARPPRIPESVDEGYSL